MESASNVRHISVTREWDFSISLDPAGGEPLRPYSWSKKMILPDSLTVAIRASDGDPPEVTVWRVSGKVIKKDGSASVLRMDGGRLSMDETPDWISQLVTRCLGMAVDDLRDAGQLR